MPADPSGVPFRSVALVGLGVMGGSLARALAAVARPPRVRGWATDPEDRRAAAEAGVLEAVVGSLGEAVSGADLVILATPLEATCALLGSLGRDLADGAVVTDVASLKAPVREAARRAGLTERWVGSHPLCGSAHSGFGASRVDLFRDATVYLTARDSSRDAYERIFQLWTALGASPVPIDAHTHDAVMTRVSHLPQMTATALAEVLRSEGVRRSALGPGGHDMTRLAVSSPEMWRDILRHAPPELVAHLHSLSRAVGELADLIEAGETDALAERMERTRRWGEGET
jgi:prephenate dehydrogenase